MADIKVRVLEILNKTEFASLATVTADGKPWVRFVSPLASEDLTLRVATFANSRKIGQIEANPEVHITAGLGTAGEMGYVQIQGRARVTNDKAERESLWKDELKAYFKGPDDPLYRVVIVEPYRIELNAPGSAGPEVWEK